MTRVELPFPPTLSACFTNVKGRGRVPTAAYKAWQKEALWMIAAQRVKPILGRVTVYVRLVAPDRRARDAGNVDKAVGDILVKANLIEDDSNRYVRKLTYEWMDDGPPCVVAIQGIEQVAA